MNKKKGFTLVEILVTIVILGILAAIAVPKLFGSIAKAKFSELPPAAATYIKLQDMYLMAKNEIGNWTSIGYDAPGSNGITKYFTYTNPELSNATTRIQDLGEEGKIGWKAVNTKSLGGCIAGNQWAITIIPDGENKIKYEAEVSSENCLGLASAWGTVNKALDGTAPVANKSVMTPENVEVKSGAWCSAKAYCGNEGTANRFRVTNSESESGLFKLEANSTYEFKIKAGSQKETNGALTGNDLNIGIMIYETDSQNAKVAADMGWTSNQKAIEKGNYTMNVTHDPSTNEYVVTIQTKENSDAYFGVNMRSNTSERASGKKVSEETLAALTNAAKTATMTKVTEEYTAGSSSSKK